MKAAEKRDELQEKVKALQEEKAHLLEEIETLKAIPHLTPRILRTVPMHGAFLFFTDIGHYTGEFASSLTDFCEKLKKIPLSSIEFHHKRGDFERWIREMMGDEYLADEMSKIGRLTQGEELRTTIRKIVERRLYQLKATMM